MLVSYIISTFNRREVLRRHLGMVMEQTRTLPLEVLVCDDGSTDGTGNMVEGMAKSLRFPLHYFNTGNTQINTAAQSRNNGIKAARGDLVIFMDDDCLPHRQLIESYVRDHKPTHIQLGYKSSCRHYLELPLPVPVEDGNMTVWWNDWQRGAFAHFQTGNCAMSLEAARTKAKDGSQGFDERFRIYGHEDSEFGQRLYRAGFAPHFNRDAVCWHMGPHDAPQQPREQKLKEAALSGELMRQIQREPAGTPKERAIFQADKIPGWMTRDELSWLYDTAARMSSVVEVGSYQGRSTYALCAACRGPVTAVDPFDPRVYPSGFPDPEDLLEKFQQHVGHFDNLRVCRMVSQKAAREIDQADLVFIDGSHEKEDVLDDIYTWLPKTKRVLAGHDFISQWPGVKQAVREVFGSNYKLCESIWYVELD